MSNQATLNDTRTRLRMKKFGVVSSLRERHTHKLHILLDDNGLRTVITVAFQGWNGPFWYGRRITIEMVPISEWPAGPEE